MGLVWGPSARHPLGRHPAKQPKLSRCFFTDFHQLSHLSPTTSPSWPTSTLQRRSLRSSPHPLSATLQSRPTTYVRATAVELFDGAIANAEGRSSSTRTSTTLLQVRHINNRRPACADNSAAQLEVKLKAPNGVNFTAKGTSAHDGPVSSSVRSYPAVYPKSQC